MISNKTDTVDSYQDYLVQKHGGFHTPASVINLVVQKATGSEPKAIQRLIHGDVSEVYDTETQKGQKVIVRISRSEYPTFETEAKVIRLVRQAGIPAPEVLLVEKIRTEKEHLTFSVENKIEGISIKALLPKLNGRLGNFQSMIRSAGEILSNVHNIRVTSFGSLDRKEESDHHSWSEFIYRVNTRIKKISQAAKSIGIDDSLVVRAIEIIKKNDKLYRNVEPHLLHGDVSLRHFLVMNWKIIGIIDFEKCKGGDPVFDFAWFDYFYKDSTYLDWLRGGYKYKEFIKDDFDQKLRVYKLYLGLTLIEYYKSERNQSGIRHLKEKFAEHVRCFEG